MFVRSAHAATLPVAIATAVGLTTAALAAPVPTAFEAHADALPMAATMLESSTLESNTLASNMTAAGDSAFTLVLDDHAALRPRRSSDRIDLDGWSLRNSPLTPLADEALFAPVLESMLSDDATPADMVPTPGSIALLGVGGLGLISRRGR